jgi:hypothetical protein
MVNITTTLSNFQRFSLIGRHDQLLSVDAIQEPAEHLYGAKPGPNREFLTSIFLPSAVLRDALAAVMAVHKPQPEGYAVPGVSAILLKKGGLELEEVDLGANRIKPIIIDLGMQPAILDQLVADLQHSNPGRPSTAQATFHVLSSLLGSIARIGTEHQLWPEPGFLVVFPAPLHSDLPRLELLEDEEGKEEDEGQADAGAETGGGQGGGDDDSVAFAGVRAVPPRGAAIAPPPVRRGSSHGGCHRREASYYHPGMLVSRYDYGCSSTSCRYL